MPSIKLEVPVPMASKPHIFSACILDTDKFKDPDAGKNIDVQIFKDQEVLPSFKGTMRKRVTGCFFIELVPTLFSFGRSYFVTVETTVGAVVINDGKTYVPLDHSARQTIGLKGVLNVPTQ